MHGLALEIRYAFRSLTRSPGLFTVALITIALGVGANTAMFSVLHSVVLRPLAYPESDRLVSLWPEKRWSQGMVADVRERVTSYEAIAVRTQQWLTLLGDGPAENVVALATSATAFDVLGVGPALGGGFVPGDAEGERGPVVVLSHEFWETRFGGDPTILDRTVRLAGLGAEDRTVVGVLPPNFPGLEPIQAVVPLAETPGQPGWYGPYGMQAMGRLRPGVTVAQASAELRGLVDELTPLHPTQFREIRYSPVDVVAAHEVTVRQIRSQLLVLMGAVGFILLIACTNVANLLLARAHARQREIAIQTALGGSAGRIMRHILTESTLLGLMGGLFGVAAAYFTLPLITAFVSGQVPRSEEIGMNTTVLVFALAISILAGLLFGAAPAVRAARTAPGQLLGGGRSQTHGRSAGRLNDGLVGAEIALCLILLAGAGLMIKSMWQLANVDTGLTTENVLAVQYTVPPGRYGSDEELDMLRRRLEEEVAAIPGVTAVTFINYLPLTGNWVGLPYTIEGGAGEDVSYVVSARVLTPGFFPFFGIPLREGRLLGPEDVAAGGENALVVNEAFARLHWPYGGAVGARVLNSEGTEPIGTIVGVVGDARLGLVHEPAQPEIFGTTAQYGFPAGGFLLVRGAHAVPSGDQVARAVAAADSEIATRNVRSMDDVVSAAAAGTRFYTRLLLGFAAIALALGVVGVYGVMSYAVSRRTRELGVRLALGATPREVAAGVVRRAMGPVGAGLALGLLGALLLTRLLAGLVFEVEPNDPWVLASVVVFLGGTGVLATLVPATRAGRVSPVQAMQAD